MNTLQQVTALFRDWLSEYPLHVQLPGVWLIYVFIIATAASLVSMLMEDFWFTADFRITDKYDRRSIRTDGPDKGTRQSVEFHELIRLAENEVRRMLFRNSVYRIAQNFGGGFLRWRFWPTHISRAFKPITCALAAMFIYAGWPDRVVIQNLTNGLNGYLRSIPWDIIRLYLPLILLVLLFLLLSPKDPIIDRIRARDEAAKDANKKLGEVAGYGSETYLHAMNWAKQLYQTKEQIVAERIEELSDHRLTYTMHSIHIIMRKRHSSFQRRDSSELKASLDALDLIVRDVRLSGLSSVAARLSRKAELFLELAGISWRIWGVSPDIHRQYWTTNSIAKLTANLLPDFQTLHPEGDEHKADNKELAIYKSWVEKDARELEAAIEEKCLLVAFHAISLATSSRILLMRTSGKRWIGILGAIHK